MQWIECKTVWKWPGQTGECMQANEYSIRPKQITNKPERVEAYLNERTATCERDCCRDFSTDLSGKPPWICIRKRFRASVYLWAITKRPLGLAGVWAAVLLSNYVFAQRLHRLTHSVCLSGLFNFVCVCVCVWPSRPACTQSSSSSFLCIRVARVMLLVWRAKLDWLMIKKCIYIFLLFFNQTKQDKMLTFQGTIFFKAGGGGGGVFLACEDFWENVPQFIPRLRFFSF